MRLRIYHIATSVFLLTSMVGYSQDLPLYNQKLTNSFLYNPSIAGNGFGSAIFSNRTFWNGVPGAPKTNLFAAHVPISQYRFGAGVTVIQERIGVSDNVYATGAFAYHVGLTDELMLSMGLSAEFTNLSYNTTRFDVRDSNDALLLNPENRSSLDFSFGVSIKHTLFELGLTSNRLATALAIADLQTQISQFYTAYGVIKLPLTADHKIEPTFAYRKLSTESSQWEAGAYYSFRDAIIGGVSYRSGGIISPAVGLRFADRFLIGYSFEMFGSGIQKEIGGTNEITLRLDFLEDNYYRRSGSGNSAMQNSLAFRRKTLSYNRRKGKPMSASNPKYKKKLKRNYFKSPSYKINKSRKLGRKKGFGKSKRRRVSFKKQRRNTRTLR